MHPLITLHIWSDYVCPFCYLEMPVLGAIQTEFGDAIEIRWRAFELRPDPIPTLQPDGEYLRTTWERAVYPMAAERGMTLRLPPVQPRSRLAFETACFAREHGQGEKMHQALFQAFFEQGRDIGEIDVLTDIGRALMLNATRLRFALEHSDYSEAVKADRREAERLGISSVPAMLLESEGKAVRLLTGAQSFDAVRDAVAETLAMAPAN